MNFFLNCAVELLFFVCSPSTTRGVCVTNASRPYVDIQGDAVSIPRHQKMRGSRAVMAAERPGRSRPVFWIQRIDASRVASRLLLFFCSFLFLLPCLPTLLCLHRIPTTAQGHSAQRFYSTDKTSFQSTNDGTFFASRVYMAVLMGRRSQGGI